MPHDILEILTNREVIAVNQDKLGKQGHRVAKSGDQEVWARELADGEYAVGLFNLASTSASVGVKWSDVGIPSMPEKARDLWTHHNFKLDGPEYTAGVPAHGVVLLRIAK
jgi:alpha-galactosidase